MNLRPHISNAVWDVVEEAMRARPEVRRIGIESGAFVVSSAHPVDAGTSIAGQSLRAGMPPVDPRRGQGLNGQVEVGNHVRVQSPGDPFDGRAGVVTGIDCKAFYPVSVGFGPLEGLPPGFGDYEAYSRFHPEALVKA